MKGVNILPLLSWGYYPNNGPNLLNYVQCTNRTKGRITVATILENVCDNLYQVDLRILSRLGYRPR